MSPRHQARAPVLPGVPVSNINSIARECQAAIKATLNLHWVGFQPVQYHKPDKQIVGLHGPGATQAVAQYEYTVVPFLATQRARYWLAVSLDFHSPRGSRITYLTHVSLLIFEGLATDQRKRPILRAEWDCKEDYLNDKHAQPHWHVYSSLVNREKEYSGSLAFDEVDSAHDFSAQQASPAQDFLAEPDHGQAADQQAWLGGELFHFALAARWQLPISEPQNEKLDLLRLGNWIKRCLSYTLEQLIYVDGKQSG
jgi:hypothetical protein